jgi:CubicO group peptidase (beta-lactamase class C family)
MPDGSLWTDATGVANVEQQSPLTRDSVFLIGDVGPLHLTAVTLRLVDRGVIGLGDPVRKWLPDIELPGLSQRVTVRHLLNNTSGIDTFALDAALQRALSAGDRLSAEDLLRFVGEPHFEPGERWDFSATNQVLLMRLVEQAADSNYFDLLAAEVSVPVGLRRTFADPLARVPDEIAFPHVDLNGDDVFEVATDYAERNRLVQTALPMTLVATDVGDEARLARALLSGDYLGTSTREQLMAHPTTANVPPWGGVRAGLTLMETDFFDAGTAIGFGGTGFGYVGNVWHFTEKNTTIVVFVNAGPGPQPELVVEALVSTVADLAR